MWLLRAHGKRPRAALPPRTPKKSRRLMSAPRLRRRHRIGSNECFDRGRKPASLLQHEMLADVRCGSFAPRYPAKPRTMSAVAPQSGNTAHRRNGAKCQRPEHVSQRSKLLSITSSARASSVGGIVDAERLGGLEIDDKLVPGRLLHRQVGRLGALENAIDVERRTTVHVVLVARSTTSGLPPGKRTGSPRWPADDVSAPDRERVCAGDSPAR